MFDEEFGPEVTYLNTASLGLPPRRSLTAMAATMDAWRVGTSEPASFDQAVADARAAFARLCRVRPEDVALGSQVSVFAGLVAASLPDGARVLLAEGDFTSIVFPFLAQQPRGVEVREVPLERVVDEIGADTTLVSVSAVQSSDGRLLDLEALAEAADRYGVRVLLDTTQAVGWLPVDASRFAFTVCGGYKWLLNPRGTAFFTIRPEFLDSLVPHTAGWYAGAEPWTSIYGGPLRLAADARRFDVSPAWLSWVGAAPALRLIEEADPEQIQAHDVTLTNPFRERVGLPPSNSAIVSVDVAPGAAEAAGEAGLKAAVRAGRLRVSFHLYSTEDDVARAATVLNRWLPDRS